MHDLEMAQVEAQDIVDLIERHRNDDDVTLADTLEKIDECIQCMQIHLSA